MLKNLNKIWPLKLFKPLNLTNLELYKTEMTKIWQILTSKTLQNQNCDKFWPLKNFKTKTVTNFDLLNTSKPKLWLNLTSKNRKWPKIWHILTFKTLQNQNCDKFWPLKHFKTKIVTKFDL